MNAEKNKASPNSLCDICQRVEGKWGQFVIMQNGDTKFTEIDRDSESWRYLHTAYGAKCDVCRVQQYCWLAKVPRNAKAVCADMVKRHFIDQIIADRYVAGQPSHRREDASVHMSPYESRLYHLGGMHLVHDGVEALNSVDMDATARQAAKSCLLQLFDRANEKLTRVELDQKLQEQDGYRSGADAATQLAIRKRPRVVGIKKTEGHDT